MVASVESAIIKKRRGREGNWEVRDLTTKGLRYLLIAPSRALTIERGRKGCLSKHETTLDAGEHPSLILPDDQGCLVKTRGCGDPLKLGN